MVDVIGGILIGLFVREWSRCIASMFRKKKPASPARAVGDLVTCSETGLPVLLTTQYSFDKFEACYITPHAKDMGAKVQGKGKNELDMMIILHAQNHERWPAYIKPLSDAEHANYAKAMLENQ